MQPEAIRNQYTPEEIQSWFNQADVNGDGTLCINEFFRWSLANASAQHGANALRVAFEKYDVDGTGHLDAIEFAKACEDLGFGAVAHQIFRSLDDDGSGTVSASPLLSSCLLIQSYLSLLLPPPPQERSPTSSSPRRSPKPRPPTPPPRACSPRS